jgi:hypothetical protein
MTLICAASSMPRRWMNLIAWTAAVCCTVERSSGQRGMLHRHLEACVAQRIRVRNNDAERSFVFEERNADDKHRPHLAQVAEVHPPQFTALDAWEGHGGRPGPKFLRQAGQVPHRARPRSLLPAGSPKPRTRAVYHQAAPKRFVSIQVKSLHIQTLPVENLNFKPRLSRGRWVEARSPVRPVLQSV